MAKLVYGERIGKQAKVRVGCSAMIVDGDGKILLTRRSDNGRWCLPSGGIDPGESAEEACIREVWEETGLNVRVQKLIGVYSSPNFIVEYADGNRVQVVAMNFQAEVTGGTLTLSNETTEVGYFSIADMEKMDVMEHHCERINDALANQSAAFIR